MSFVCRWARRLAVVVVLALAATTVIRWFIAPPQVGSWRSVQGREAYLAAYDEAMTALPTPTLTRDVATSYGTARVYGWTSREHTERTPVVLMPGMRSGTPMWADQVRAIAAVRDVYAVDAVGDAGRSIQLVPMRTFDEQAVWVEEALAGLPLARAHIVGHSFGGAIATAHAITHPRRVASLTLLEPAFTLAYPPADVFFWASVTSLPFVPESWRDHALARIGGVEVEEVRADDPVGRMIARASEHFDGHVPTPTPRSEDELRSLRVPVYVAIAERDSLAGGEDATQKADLIPYASVQTWPDTTHSLPMQTGPALTDHLEQWWRLLETTG